MHLNATLDIRGDERTRPAIMTIRVVIADEQQAVRAGLARWFEETEIEVVAEASSALELLNVVRDWSPDVLVTEARLGTDDILSTLQDLKEASGETAILVFTTHENPSFVARAMNGLASGYLLKSVSKDELLDAIRKASTGHILWTAEDQRRLQGALAVPRMAGDADAPLTHRESEVLAQVALGLTNKRIGDVLAISPDTVKEHVQRILKKIGVRDRTQAALWVVRQNPAGA